MKQICGILVGLIITLCGQAQNKVATDFLPLTNVIRVTGNGQFGVNRPKFTVSSANWKSQLTTTKRAGAGLSFLHANKWGLELNGSIEFNNYSFLNQAAMFDVKYRNLLIDGNFRYNLKSNYDNPYFLKVGLGKSMMPKGSDAASYLGYVYSYSAGGSGWVLSGEYGFQLRLSGPTMIDVSLVYRKGIGNGLHTPISMDYYPSNSDFAESASAMGRGNYIGVSLKFHQRIYAWMISHEPARKQPKKIF